MTDPVTGSAAQTPHAQAVAQRRCECGHVRRHHRIGCCRYHDGCEWKGCGCPEYVEVKP